jgi:hypothetical protein
MTNQRNAIAILGEFLDGSAEGIEAPREQDDFIGPKSSVTVIAELQVILN